MFKQILFNNYYLIMELQNNYIDNKNEKINLLDVVFEKKQNNVSSNKFMKQNNVSSNKFIKKNNSLKGFNALINNESNNNSAFGFSCMKSNINGYQNTSLGSYSMIKNLCGINNTAIGFRSLNNLNSDSNTAIGSFSGLNLKNGKLNVLIGRNAETSDLNSINEIVIGSYAKGHKSNSIVLGNDKIISIEPGKKSNVDLGSDLFNFKNIYYSGKLIKENTYINNYLNEENIDLISNGDYYKNKIININESTSIKTLNLIPELSGSIFYCNLFVNNLVINLPSLLDENNIGITYSFLLSNISENTCLNINMYSSDSFNSSNNDSDKDSDKDSDEIKTEINNDIKKSNEFIIYNKYDFMSNDNNKIIFNHQTPINTLITFTSINFDLVTSTEKWMIDVKIPQ